MEPGSRADGGAGGRPAPVVTVTGGPALTRAPQDPGPRPRAAWLVVPAAVALLAAAVVLGRPDPPPVPPPVDVELRLSADAADALLGSQSGVLVLPVDVVVAGPSVRLGRSVLWAEPVRQQTVLSGRSRFDAGSTGRVRVLVQPDCSLLGPTQGHRLVLTAELELIGPDDQRVQRVIDLGGQPAVRARVAALCRPPAPPG